MDLIESYKTTETTITPSVVFRSYKAQILKMLKDNYSYKNIIVFLKAAIKDRDLEQLSKQLNKESLYHWVRRNVTEDEIKNASNVSTVDSNSQSNKKSDMFKHLLK